jgi:hypothetical protein
MLAHGISALLGVMTYCCCDLFVVSLSTTSLSRRCAVLNWRLERTVYVECFCVCFDCGSAFWVIIEGIEPRIDQKHQGESNFWLLSKAFTNRAKSRRHMVHHRVLIFAFIPTPPNQGSKLYNPHRTALSLPTNLIILERINTAYRGFVFNSRGGPPQIFCC